MKQNWVLADLPHLMTLDNLAFRAEGWQKPTVAMIGAKTWHWALVGLPQPDNEISIGDWSVVDSTSKGMTTHLLSEYQGRHMRVYRPVMLPGVQLLLAQEGMKWANYYGICRYDGVGVSNVALWCILRKLGIKVGWWEDKIPGSNVKFWCLESNAQILNDVGFRLIPKGEPAYPKNFEASTKLELIWGTF